MSIITSRLLHITQGDCTTEEELREMYVQWPFFREMIDLIAMTLSKTDYSISTNYEKQVRRSRESHDNSLH
jgi:phosphoenolpyruvate carboxylase